MSRVCALVLTTMSLTAACLSLGTSGASAASFGRCIKLAGETGKYRSAGCQEGQFATGKWEWYPAFGSKEISNKNFKLKLTETATIYEAPEVVAFSCGKGEGNGEFTGNTQVGSVQLTLKECKEGGERKCTNTGTEGEVKTETLDGAIGVWKSEPEERHDKIGLELHSAAGGEGGTFIGTMTCGGSTTRELTGSIISMVPPPGPNKMGESWSLKYMHRGLEQMPEQFEGVPAPTLFEQSLNGKSSTHVAVEATIEQENTEEMELNATCTCR